MIFECKRCGHIETHKGNFLKHLNRKTQCKPILQDIGIETLKQELETKITKNTKIAQECSFLEPPDSKNDSSDSISAQNKHECKYCKKIYSKNSNLHRHMKICKKKENEISKKQDELAELKEKLAEKDEEIAKKKRIYRSKISGNGFFEKTDRNTNEKGRK